MARVYWAGYGNGCYGSFLDARTVVVPGWCATGGGFYEEDVDQLIVVVGDQTGASYYDDGDERIPVRRIVLHPGYDDSSGPDNVAMLHLDHAPIFRKIRPVAIAPLSATALWGGEAGRAAGTASTGPWIAGWDPPSGASAPKLREALAPVLAQSTCGELSTTKGGYAAALIPVTICVGALAPAGTSAGIGHCGDEGGAPVIGGVGNRRWALIGITLSGAVTCGSDYLPPTLLLGAYQSWITANRSKDRDAGRVFAYGTGDMDLRVTQLASTSLRIAWTRPSGVKQVWVTQQGARASEWELLGRLAKQSFYVRGLKPGATYKFAIDSVRPNGEDGFRDVISIRTRPAVKRAR